MLKSANLLHKQGLDDSQLHTTVVSVNKTESILKISFVLPNWPHWHRTNLVIIWRVLIMTKNYQKCLTASIPLVVINIYYITKRIGFRLVLYSFNFLKEKPYAYKHSSFNAQSFKYRLWMHWNHRNPFWSSLENNWNCRLNCIIIDPLAKSLVLEEKRLFKNEAKIT